jgi:oxalate decarboxylase/phosphoglucose isomerase-like protein (cupin superfamily)
VSIVEDYTNSIKTVFGRTTYAKWQQEEGVQTYEGFGVGQDVRTLELAPWPRLGGNALFLNLYPLMEGVRGLYVAEIPPGGALEPERHLYEKVVFILDGQGTTEVWQPGDSRKHVFEWGRGAIFAPPLNTWHRMYNVGTRPVRFLAVTDAPLVMNGFRNPEFVFGCDFAFRERFDGQSEYFTQSQKRYATSRDKTATNIWETNFVANAFEADLTANEVKAHGNRSAMFEIAGNSLIGHISEWPVGCYHKAHYHDAGALLMGLRSEGYVLLWPTSAGWQPYQDGHADEVVEVRWGPGTIYAPPAEWFHQHFNTGAEPARQLAVRHGSRLSGPGFNQLTPRSADRTWNPQHLSVRVGGHLLDYEDEDPEIRRRYTAAIQRNGVDFAMPDEIYVPGAAKDWHDPRLEALVAGGD